MSKDRIDHPFSENVKIGTGMLVMTQVVPVSRVSHVAYVLCHRKTVPVVGFLKTKFRSINNERGGLSHGCESDPSDPSYY